MMMQRRLLSVYGVVVILMICVVSDALQLPTRRDAVISAAGLLGAPSIVSAQMEAESVDISAFNAARSGSSSSATAAVRSGKVRSTINPSLDPPPLLPIRGGRNGKTTIQIPRVGYSLYKTAPELVSRCTAIALRAGVRHFDVASLYGSNAEIAAPLKMYLGNGLKGLAKVYKEEKDELLELLDATSLAGEKHAVETIGFGSRSISPTIDGSAGGRQRRESLFISHKISNAEQSTDAVAVGRSVKKAIAELGVGYLDMVSIHSPLTDKERRLATYQALQQLRDGGFVKAISVCNYGVGPLEEIAALVGDNIGDYPAMNQLELSPFNQHSEVVNWCRNNGVAVGCSAWSKLSGVDGPAEGWAVLSDLAKAKGVTKAQLLVRWSLQKGYVCVPRSGSKSKLERVAIAENSYGGVNPIDTKFVLSQEDMKILDGLDIGYKAGRLGRRDGWADEDVTGPDWDPTEVV
jgi:diketogulonate reductase-like aldo/keto reductase